MWQKVIFLIFLFGLWSVATFACDQIPLPPNSYPFPDDLQQKIAQILTQMTISSCSEPQAADAPSATGFSVMLINAQEPSLSTFLSGGCYDREKPTAAPTSDMIYQLASVSKVFCAYGVYQAVKDKKIASLDDEIQKVVPDFTIQNRFSNTQPTWRQMLSQLAGMPHSPLCDEPCNETTETILKRTAESQRQLDGFVSPMYSNFGFDLLGHLVAEKLYGMPFAQFLKQYITDPLNMTETGVDYEAFSNKSWAVPYDASGNVVPPASNNLYWSIPDGGIFSSASDMGKFVSHWLKLWRTDSLIRLMLSPVYINNDLSSGWSMPWELVYVNPYLVRTKGGNMAAVTSDIALIPELQIGVVLLWNGENLPFQQAVVQQLFAQIVPAFSTIYSDAFLNNPSILQPPAGFDPLLGNYVYGPAVVSLTYSSSPQYSNKSVLLASIIQGVMNVGYYQLEFVPVASNASTLAFRMHDGWGMPIPCMQTQFIAINGAMLFVHNVSTPWLEVPSSKYGMQFVLDKSVAKELHGDASPKKEEVKNLKDGPSSCPKHPHLPEKLPPFPDDLKIQIQTIVTQMTTSACDRMTNNMSAPVPSPPGFSGAIIFGDDISFIGSGCINKSTGIAPTPDTTYQLASVTKSFSAFLIYRAYQDKKIDSVDDPVSKYVPELFINNPIGGVNDQPTWREIASQLSGLPRESPCSFTDCQTTTNLVLEQLKEWYVVFPSYEWPSYSNLGFALLGHLIAERLYQISYYDLMHQHIFPSIGMNNTGVNYTDVPPGTQFATPYDITMQPQPLFSLGWAGPAGSFVSTARDLAQWEHFLMTQWKTDPLIREMFLPLFLNPSMTTGWGTPWEFQNFLSYQIRTKDGGLTGITTIIAMVPELQFGLVLLWNGEGFDSTMPLGPALEIVFPALEQLLSAEYEAQFPPLPTGAEKCTGIYKLHADGQDMLLNVSMDWFTVNGSSVNQHLTLTSATPFPPLGFNVMRPVPSLTNATTLVFAVTSYSPAPFCSLPQFLAIEGMLTYCILGAGTEPPKIWVPGLAYARPCPQVAPPNVTTLPPNSTTAPPATTLSPTSTPAPIQRRSLAYLEGYTLKTSANTNNLNAAQQVIPAGQYCLGAECAFDVTGATIKYSFKGFSQCTGNYHLSTFTEYRGGSQTSFTVDVSGSCGVDTFVGFYSDTWKQLSLYGFSATPAQPGSTRAKFGTTGSLDCDWLQTRFPNLSLNDTICYVESEYADTRMLLVDFSASAFAQAAVDAANDGTLGTNVRNATLVGANGKKESSSKTLIIIIIAVVVVAVILVVVGVLMTSKKGTGDAEAGKDYKQLNTV